MTHSSVFFVVKILLALAVLAGSLRLVDTRVSPTRCMSNPRFPTLPAAAASTGGPPQGGDGGTAVSTQGGSTPPSPVLRSAT